MFNFISKMQNSDTYLKNKFFGLFFGFLNTSVFFHPPLTFVVSFELDFSKNLRENCGEHKCLLCRKWLILTTKVDKFLKIMISQFQIKSFYHQNIFPVLELALARKKSRNLIFRRWQDAQNNKNISR